MTANTFLRSALALVFPIQCESCGRALDGASQGLCGACRASIRLIAAPHCHGCGRTSPEERCAKCRGERFYFDRAFACALYEGSLKKALQAYKYGGQKILKSFFADMLENFLKENLKERRFEAVLAVPMDGAKKKERGFNQSELLTAEIAKRFGVDNLSPTLRRRKSTLAQARLTKAGRRENVKDGFFCVQETRLAGKRLLLVDDILTTGQTASECARALKKSGAAEITVLACARGELR